MVTILPARNQKRTFIHERNKSLSYLRSSKKDLLFPVRYITISEGLLRVVIDQKYIQHETLFPAASYYDLSILVSLQ